MTIIIDRWQHLLTTHVRITRTTFLVFLYATFESATLAMKNGWKVSFTRRETDTIFLARFVSINTLDFLLLFVFPAFVFPPRSMDGDGKKERGKKKKSKRRKSVLDHGRRVVGKPKKRANLFFQREDTRTD